MAKFVVRKKRNKSGTVDEVLYYAVPVSKGVIDAEYLSGSISRRCTLTRGDVKAAITELACSLQQYLTDGYTVHLEGIGYFTVSASSEGFTDPQECTPRRVKAKRICFRADKHLKEVLKDVRYKPDTSVSKKKK